MGRLSFLRPCFLGLLTIPNKCCMPCVLIREEEKVMRRTVSTFYHASRYHTNPTLYVDRRQDRGAHHNQH
jgi:hypothetical protein